MAMQTRTPARKGRNPEYQHVEKYEVEAQEESLSTAQAVADATSHRLREAREAEAAARRVLRTLHTYYTENVGEAAREAVASLVQAVEATGGVRGPVPDALREAEAALTRTETADTVLAAVQSHAERCAGRARSLRRQLESAQGDVSEARRRLSELRGAIKAQEHRETVEALFQKLCEAQDQDAQSKPGFARPSPGMTAPYEAFFESQGVTDAAVRKDVCERMAAENRP
jgi:chromosome segregation ATPase